LIDGSDEVRVTIKGDEIRVTGSFLPPINLPPVPYRQREYDHSPVLDFADNPEVADTVAPQAAKVPFERLAEMARILATLYPVIEPAQDAPRDRLVQFPQLLLSKRGNFNGPGQALS
jgi:hypothetical protein